MLDDGSLFSFENLHRQYVQCRRNKRNTDSALAFEVEQEKHLLALSEALQSHQYRPGPSVCFVAQKPKLREIFAADFPDRIVHHVLVNELERYWEPRFIYDSYACRKNKGIHRAVDRLQGFMRQVSSNGVKPAYYLQLDIHNFFMSMDKSLLFERLRSSLNNNDVEWLCRTLVFHDCTQHYHYAGRPSLLTQLPAHKSLLQAPAGKGMPIGNLNSQFFANVYLDVFDQFVKHQLKCGYYLRYCDDFILLSTDREQLQSWQQQITTFLKEELLLRLNPKRQTLQRVDGGADFLGYIVRPHYRLVRQRVIGNCSAKLTAFEQQLVREEGLWRVCRFDRNVVDALQATLASYLGHYRHANSWRLQQQLWRRFYYLQYYFTVADAGRLQRRDRVPNSLRSVRKQYQFIRRSYPDALLLFKVGSFYEWFDGQGMFVAKLLGLKPLTHNRRGALYGFPVAQLPSKIVTLQNVAPSILFVNELDAEGGGLKRRVPGELWVKKGDSRLSG